MKLGNALSDIHLTGHKGSRHTIVEKAWGQTQGHNSHTRIVPEC